MCIKELVSFWLPSKPFINRKSFCVGARTDEFRLYLQMPEQSRMEMVILNVFLSFVLLTTRRVICNSSTRSPAAILARMLTNLSGLWKCFHLALVEKEE